MTITEWIVVAAGIFALACGLGVVGLVAWWVYGWWKAR